MTKDLQPQSKEENKEAEVKKPKRSMKAKSSKPKSQDSKAKSKKTEEKQPTSEPMKKENKTEIKKPEVKKPEVKKTHKTTLPSQSKTKSRSRRNRRVDAKKQRNDWKKKAIELETQNKQLEERLAKLEADSSSNANEDEPPANKLKVEVPEFKEIDKENLSQEVKDLLDFTPGLEKLIGDIAGMQAQAIIEKLETDRATTLQEAEQAQQSEEQETSYWNEMDTWFQGQYPELTLSEIRQDPDFQDWMELRKNWVDAQLNGVSRNDVSGAQKVFERYIKENELATPSDDKLPENTTKRLAAARTPSASKKSVAPKKTQTNLFQEEARRLEKQSPRRYV